MYTHLLRVCKQCGLLVNVIFCLQNPHPTAAWCASAVCACMLEPPCYQSLGLSNPNQSVAAAAVVRFARALAVP
jgi:hypothetical protein